MLVVSGNRGKEQRDLIAVAMGDQEIKANGGDAVALIGKLVRELNKIPEDILAAEAEEFALKQAKDFLAEQFGCKVNVYSAEKPEYDPARKARNAMPMKPAIFIE